MKILEETHDGGGLFGGRALATQRARERAGELVCPGYRKLDTAA